MKLRSVFLLGAVFALASVEAAAQIRDRTSDRSEPPKIVEAVRATPAYAEIMLRKVELESEYEELLVSYKANFPKVKNTRYELDLLEAELVRFGRLGPSDAPRLTIALGKLIVRRASLATDYWIVSNKYSSEHPTAKKAKKKVEIFDRAVESIL